MYFRLTRCYPVRLGDSFMASFGQLGKQVDDSVIPMFISRLVSGPWSTVHAMPSDRPGKLNCLFTIGFIPAFSSRHQRRTHFPTRATQPGTLRYQRKKKKRGERNQYPCSYHTAIRSRSTTFESTVNVCTMTDINEWEKTNHYSPESTGEREKKKRSVASSHHDLSSSNKYALTSRNFRCASSLSASASRSRNRNPSSTSSLPPDRPGSTSPLLCPS